MSDDVPYCEVKSPAQVVISVNSGTLPAQPQTDDAVHRGLSDELWNVMTWCWDREPDGRPSAANVLEDLEKLS